MFNREAYLKVCLEEIRKHTKILEKIVLWPEFESPTYEQRSRNDNQKIVALDPNLRYGMWYIVVEKVICRKKVDENRSELSIRHIRT
jgi:hypothetical protein